MERAAFTFVIAGVLAFGGFAQTRPARDSPPTKTERTGIISGRVVAADSGEPIRKARVTAGSSAAPAVTMSISGPIPPPRRLDSPVAFTDNDGRFLLAGVPPGPIFLSATKAGYVRTTFGARRPGIPPVAIDVARAGRIDGIDIRMAKSGSISGRIVDEFDEPVEGVVVSAQKLLRVDGFTSIMRLADSVSDDRGDYRLGGLPAGKFLVTATRNSTDVTFRGQPLPDGRTGFEIETPQSRAMYYPGVAALTGAQPIDVRAGEQRTRIDFAVGASQPPRLTIAFVNANSQSSDRIGDCCQR